MGKVRPRLGLVQFLLGCIWPGRENIQCHSCLTPPLCGLAGYISLGIGDRSGDIFWCGSHVAQGDLYFILSYPSCPASTVGMAFDHETSRSVVMAPKHYQGLRAWWHRQPRSRDRSQAVFQLTDKDVPSAGGQQPCLRLPHPACLAFCLYI